MTSAFRRRVEHAAVIRQPQGLACVLEVGGVAHERARVVQRVAVPQDARVRRGDHPADLAHARDEMLGHLGQHVVARLVPGDEAGRPGFFRALAEADIGMHVVFLAVHRLHHRVQARAILVGGRLHVVLALLPAPDHAVQERPAVRHAAAGGRLQHLHQRTGDVRRGPQGLGRRCGRIMRGLGRWRRTRDRGGAGQQVVHVRRAPRHLLRRNAMDEQLARGLAPCGERVDDERPAGPDQRIRGLECGRRIHHAACSSGHKFICCGASARLRRSRSDDAVPCAGL